MLNHLRCLTSSKKAHRMKTCCTMWCLFGVYRFLHCLWRKRYLFSEENYMKNSFLNPTILGLLLLASTPTAVLAVSKTMTWDAVTATTDGVAGIPDSYTLYRSIDNSITWTKVPCSELTSDPKLLNRMCTDANVPNGSTSYQVTASNGKGESTPSNRVLFFLPGAVPNSPTNLRPVTVTSAVKRLHK